MVSKDKVLNKGVFCRFTYHQKVNYQFRGDIKYGEGRKYDGVVVAPGWEFHVEYEYKTIDSKKSIQKSSFGHRNIVLVDWTPEDLVIIKNSRNPKRLVQSLVKQGKKLFDVGKFDLDFLYGIQGSQDTDTVKKRVYNILRELSVITDTQIQCDDISDNYTPKHILLSVDFLDRILSTSSIKKIRDEQYWKAYISNKKRSKHQWARLLKVGCGVITKWGKKYGVKMGFESSMSINQMESLLSDRMKENSPHWKQYWEKLQELKQKEDII